jgi:protein-tyrosine phosphatase
MKAEPKDLKTVLFLCTGNYYRSRFAELYFNALAPVQGLPWRADSRGLRLNALNPGPISQATVAWLRQRGVLLPRAHRYPQPVREADLDAADLVVAVKHAEHHPLLAASFPGWSERVEFWHVHDLDFAPPETALAELAVCVETLLRRLGA